MQNKPVKVPVEYYSRVVGYFSPVKSNWNKGKKEEFKERKYIKIPEEMYAKN